MIKSRLGDTASDRQAGQRHDDPGTASKRWWFAGGVDRDRAQSRGRSSGGLSAARKSTADPRSSPGPPMPVWDVAVAGYS